MIRRNASKTLKVAFLLHWHTTTDPMSLSFAITRGRGKKSDRMICWDNEKFVIVALIHARNEEVWYYCFDWRSLVSGHD